MRKAAFLDRDGVINIDHAYVSRREDFEWVEGVLDAARKLYEAGARMFVAGTSSLVKPQVEGIDERIAENRKNICPME